MYLVRTRACIAALIWLGILAGIRAEIGPIRPTAIEPVGPSSRTTGLVITEIMYNPTNRTDGRSLEFVEIYNSEVFPLDISKFQITGAIDYTFPTNRSIPALSYLVIAKDTNLIKSIYGITNFVGPYTNSLSKEGTVRLVHRSGAVLLEAEYSNKPPYPPGADGAGHSLVLARPSYGERDPFAWDLSDVVGGSPGKPDPRGAEPMRSIVINEFLAHTDDPQLDFIELFNNGSAPVNLKGAVLTDDPSTNRFVFGDTVIPARGFISLDQNQLKFSLNAAGETIYLWNTNQTRVIDAIRFGAQENGVSTGRYPDGAPNLQALATPTPNLKNTGRRLSRIVINELMFKPISGNSDMEYLELYNRWTNTINLGGWKFTSGISYEFPTNAQLAPGAYLVVAKNADLLKSFHSHLNGANLFGNYNGTLGNGGERIALSKPDDIVFTNSQGHLETNKIFIVENELTYGEGGRWGRWSAGGGSSLELIDPDSDNRLPSNWADSDETGKSAWGSFQTTGVLDNGQGAAANFQMFLQGEGEALVDNIQVLDTNGVNILMNGNFDLGTTGWFFQGSQDNSTIQTNDVLSFASEVGINSLHIRSTFRGDTGANRIRGTFAKAPDANTVFTIKGQARWLKGTPEILFRIKGNYLELPGHMPVPNNLGTPGLANSRKVANAGPAIYDVSHTPVLPSASQPVVVTARIDDPDGVASITLQYRQDLVASYTAVPMKDDGTDGDAIAGDGLYSATIPAQSAGSTVAFIVQSSDSKAAPASSRFPADDGPMYPNDLNHRECLVRWGETSPAGALGVYRIWVTSNTVNRWTTREHNSNEPFDGTFVYGNHRVIYSIDTWYSGSPWHTPGYNGPTGGICDYVLRTRPDALLLGVTDFVLASSGNLDNDPAVQHEQAAFWILENLDVPYLRRRFIHMYFNGVRRGRVYEDAQQPGSEYVKEWFPGDDDGPLHKIEDWFEFDDTNGDGKDFNVDARLHRYTTPMPPGSTNQVLKTARYRWNFRRRAVGESDSYNNYTDFFRLVEAANHTNVDEMVRQVSAQVDIEEWMRVLAVEHIVGNWDSYGYNRGKNMFAYKPDKAGWRLLAWDIDFVLGHDSDGPQTDPFTVGEGDNAIDRFYKTAPFRRLYLRAIYDAISGPMKKERFEPFVDAKYNGLRTNDVALDAPSGAKDFVKQRVTYLTNNFISAPMKAPFQISNNSGSSFTTNNNFVVLTGTASLKVNTIKLNGVVYPIRWTSITNWEIRVALNSGINPYRIEGFDRNGTFVSGSSDTIAVTYSLTNVPPQNALVINEIMYNPLVPGASYVEIANLSTNFSFNLYGYRLEGLDFAFAQGTVIEPGKFLVVAANSQAFGRAYGFHIPVAGEFKGSLDNGGERIRLVKPGSVPANDLIVDQVAYDDDLPWPAAADGTGSSLQLVDPRQDNRRVANWKAAAPTPGASNSVLATLPAFELIWINEIQPSNSVSVVDSAGEHDPWIELYNAGATAINLSGFSLSDTYTNLTKWTFPSGASLPAGGFLVVFADGQESQTRGTEYHTNFRLNGTNGSIALVRQQLGQPAVMDYINYRNVGSSRSYGSYPDGQPDERQIFFIPTPGAANNPNLPPVKINEWLASNVTKTVDPADNKFEDWIELYNAGTQPVDLSGYAMTDDLANWNQWKIPNGTIIPAGGFLLIWADGQTSQTTATDIHANFKLSSTGEAIGLFTPEGVPVDTITFAAQADDVSQGRYPDGAADIYSMPQVTPRAPNKIPDQGGGAGPHISGISMSGNTLTLSWETVSGRKYQVQYKDDLNAPTWTNLGSVITATTTTLQSSDDTTNRPKRFYRITVVP